jgi:uncharacterized protein involved in exopolysaccharide biosynthesis
MSYDSFFKSWCDKPLLFPACLGASFVLCAVLLNIMTPRYTVESVVGPTSRDSAAEQLPRRGSSDDLVHIGLVERSDEETLSDFARFMQLLTTPEIAERLLKNKDLHAETLISGSGLIDSTARLLAGQKTRSEKGAALLAVSLKKSLVINSIGRSAMREIVLRHPDREFGTKLLNELIAETDRHLKEKAQYRTASEIVYLRNALERVSMADHRKVLAELLAAQEQTQMMLAVDLPFAADVIQSASAPDAPDWPPAALCFLVALFLGGFVAVSIHYWRSLT